MATKSTESSPLKIAPLAVAGIMAAPAIIQGVGHLFGAGKRRKIRDAEKAFDTRIEDYEASEFQPLDRDALRRENVFEGQENIMEDMEVDTQAADYAREQFQQQQANIMQGLRGVAGASGAAGLAQALSGQASKQAQESQITIGQQLQQARKMRLQEQSRINQQVLTEESRLNEADRAVQLADMQGARQFELDKMTTMMGVEGQRIAGARADYEQQQQTWGQVAGAVGQIGGAYLGTSGK